METKIKRPEEILSDRKVERAKFIDETVRLLANELSEKYFGERVEIFLDGKRAKFEGIIDDLVAEFEECGWALSITSKSYGDTTSFRIGAINYPINADKAA